MKKIRNRVLAVITVLIIVMGVFSPVTFRTSVTEVQAANVGKKQQEAVDWCKSLIGTAGTNEDGAYGVQCVDLIRRYTKWLGKDIGKAAGNGAAYNYGTQSIPTDYYSRYGNGTNPQPGDIFVWNAKSYGAYGNGHVGVIYAVDANYYYYIDYAPSRGNTDLARGPKGNTKKGLHEFNYIIRPNFPPSCPPHNIPAGSAWVEKAPTKTSTGLWRFRCSKCGNTDTTMSIPALGDANLKAGTYMIQSALDSNKYVSVTPYQSYREGNIALYDRGVADQNFHITKNNDGTYRIGYMNFVLDVRGGNANENVWLWDDNGGGTQKWYIVPADDRGYRVVNQAVYFNLDVQDAKTANGTNIFSYMDNNGTNQRFKFILVECDQHSWDGGKVTKKATADEEGEIVYTCKDCHKTKTEKISKNHIHDYQIVSRISPTCTEDGTTTIHCPVCGVTITKKGDIDLYSEWTAEKPKVSSGTTIQTMTQYSFSKREMGWKAVETGTIDYGSDWKGFDTGNSFYSQYNKTPVTAYENATTKVTVNTSHLGYIYWHWCSGNVYDKPYNRYVKSNRQNGYTTFHAYYSTEDIPFNAKANGYEKSKADICRDTYWWLQERIDVKRCSYTKYEKAQVGDFKTWSQWSDTPVKEDGNTKVKTRTLYRTRTFIAGKATGHKLVIDPKVPATETKTGLTEGSHCSVCNKVIKPQKVIPAKWKEISSEKIKNTELKKNVVVADKKKGGKYRITKVTKKGKKVTGGTVEYVAPYDKNCKLVSATGKVKLGGATFKVTSIRKDAFSGCTKLKKVVIGSYVKDIGANAFYGCKSLKSVTIKSSSIKKIGTNAFKGINSKAKIIVPKKKLSAYRKLIKKAKAPRTVKVITK